MCSGRLGKDTLEKKAEKRKGLPVVRGLAACALGIAVAAMLGAAPTDAVPGDPAALPAVSADDGQVTVTVPTEVPCVMLGDGSIIGPATWSIENGSDKAARLANVHAERKALSVEASATAKGGTALLEVSPASATFNQGFTLDAGSSADFGWSAAVTDDVERSEALSGALLGPTSLLTLTFTFAAVEDEPQPSAASAFAVFSADDASLTLYKRADAPVEGTAFLGKEVTRVYTGIENSRSTQPWNDVADRIASVSVADAGVAPKSLYAWFFGCTSLTNVDLSPLDTSSATTFRQMLYGCSSLKEIDLSGFKTARAKSFASMLNGCASLEKVDVTGFDLSSAEDLSMFFFNCKSLSEADLATTGMSKVRTLYGAFGGCSSLRSVDVSALDVSSVTNFAYCFSGCSKLERLDLSGWDASSARDLNHFLSGCASLAQLDLSGLHTEGATDFSYFLYGCKALKELDLTGISTAGASSGYGMFSGMSSLREARLGAAFSWVGDAYLPLPSAAGVPGTDGKWHSLASGKAYLPADVPDGVEDTYSALPPATGAAAEEAAAPEDGQAAGDGEETGAPRCTALVEEAIQGGSAYGPPSFDGLTER